MPKTLDTQGFSGLREEVVRSEGCTSRFPVLQEIKYLLYTKTPDFAKISGVSLLGFVRDCPPLFGKFEIKTVCCGSF